MLSYHLLEEVLVVLGVMFVPLEQRHLKALSHWRDTFVKVVDAEMLAFSQGVTRRGSYAGYLHMSHPEDRGVLRC